MSAETVIDNRVFRRALLSLNGLAPPGPGDQLAYPTAAAGPEWVHGMVLRLGFVQVDPICAIERAHQQILFSRNRRSYAAPRNQSPFIPPVTEAPPADDRHLPQSQHLQRRYCHD